MADVTDMILSTLISLQYLVNRTVIYQLSLSNVYTVHVYIKMEAMLVVVISN